MAVNYTNLYNRLANKVNKLRKRILRRKRQQEREDEALRIRGIYPRPRPDVEVPMKQRLISPTKEQLTKEAYEAYRQQIKDLFGSYSASERDFYRVAYKQNYLDVLKDNGQFIGEEPKGYQGRSYTEEQIRKAEQEDPEKASLMKLYNSISYMGIGEFMYNYDRGYIVKLGYIYQGATDAKTPNWYEEQREFIAQSRRELLGKFSLTEIKRGIPFKNIVAPSYRWKRLAQYKYKQKTGHYKRVRAKRGRK